MDLGWNTYAARLASFEATIPISSKKKVSKQIAWPHKNPSPESLALNGLHWKPSSTSPDNTQCFLCDRALDGWEPADDPITEHLKHSPQCGWAILMHAGRDGFDAATMEDPTCDRLRSARRATFRDLWPHDGKRGWQCKTDALVDSGFFFAPTPESEDFVSCAYCKLGLDGWEPRDSCFDEHHRRSPECPFFSFQTSAPKRGKMGRASKASRMSTQSNMTVASEAPSIPDLDESIDGSILSIKSVATTASKMGKKNSQRKGKGKRASKIETFEAPSTEIFEVEVSGPEGADDQANTRALRGGKRGSDQISEDGRGDRESTVKPEPPPKRRNTRTRASVVDNVDYASLQAEPDSMDVEQAQPKALRAGRKRATSRARKTSAASTASLRAAIPDNAAIDAALEADLDRPMSDEDEPQVAQQPKKTRGRKPKHSVASTAPMRAPRDSLVESEIPEPIAHLEASQEREVASVAYEADVEGAAPEQSKSTKSKMANKTTAKRATRTNRGSNESIATVATDIEPQIDSSMITTRTEADDSGHETDASVAGKSVVRKGSKRKAPGKVRGKKAGTGVMSKNIEDIVQSQPQSQGIAALAAAAEPEPSLAVAAQRVEEKMEIDEPVAVVVVHAAQEEEASKKSAKPTTKTAKTKSAKTKKAKAAERPPQLSMPGAFSPLMPEQDQDIDPSFASVLSPNSPPVIPALAANQQVAVEAASPSIVSPAPHLPPRSPLRSMISSARPTPTPQRSVQRNTQESTPSPSPQSSDAENAPPSSRPASTRPPLAPLSPSKNMQMSTRVPLAPGTPRAVPLSPSKIGGGLRSDVPWTSVDVEMIFTNTPGTGKENVNASGTAGAKDGALTSPEKKMTVEEWINWNAQKAEEDLRAESERVVGVFEKEGGRALRVLEGIEVTE